MNIDYALNIIIPINYLIISVLLFIIYKNVLLDLNNIYNNLKQLNISILAISSLFLLCSMHYIGPFMHFEYTVLIDAILSILCVYTSINFLLNIKNILNIVRFTVTITNRELNNDILLKSIKQNSTLSFGVIKVTTPYKEAKLIWSTNSFNEWFNNNSNILSHEEDKEENWYEVFNISNKWKRDHVNIIENKLNISNENEYIKIKNKYVKWSMIYLQDNQILIILEDITKFIENEIIIKNEIEEQKIINKTLVNLGLEQYKTNA